MLKRGFCIYINCFEFCFIRLNIVFFELSYNVFGVLVLGIKFGIIKVDWFDFKLI